MRIESNDIIDIATAYREAGMHNRTAEPLDDVWISAINESASTLVPRPQYKERLEQAWEHLSQQYEAAHGRVLRDPETGRQFANCLPNCIDTLCQSNHALARESSVKFDGVYCSKCEYCALEDGTE